MASLTALVTEHIGRIIGHIIKPVKEACARHRARDKANKGDDLAGQGSLENLVRVELQSSHRVKNSLKNCSLTGAVIGFV
jgi:hypothetical protein